MRLFLPFLSLVLLFREQFVRTIDCFFVMDRQALIVCFVFPLSPSSLLISLAVGWRRFGNMFVRCHFLRIEAFSFFFERNFPPHSLWGPAVTPPAARLFLLPSFLLVALFTWLLISSSGVGAIPYTSFSFYTAPKPPPLGWRLGRSSVMDDPSSRVFGWGLDVRCRLGGRLLALHSRIPASHSRLACSMPFPWMLYCLSSLVLGFLSLRSDPFDILLRYPLPRSAGFS